MDDAITPVDPKKNNATEARPSRKSQIYKVDVIPQTVSPVPRTEKQVFHVHTKKKKATEAGPSRKSQNYDLYHRDGVETEDIKQRTAIPEKQVFHVHTKRNNPIEAGPSRKSQNPKINVMYQTDSPFPKTGNPKTPLDPNHLSVLNKYNQMDPNKFIQTADLTPMSSNLQRFRFTNEKSRRRSLDSKLKSNPLSTSQVHLKETNSSPATQASLRGFLEDTNKASNLDMEIVSKEPNNVIWLIGSDENPNFDNAYGRRLMEKFFEIAVDSESLLMVHGTKKFCEKIEHLYKHSKLRSGKKKIMGYVTGRLSIQNNFPRIRFTSAAGDQAPIRDKPIFQCVFVFEKGDHQYTKEVEQCTDGVPIVIIQDDTGANRDPSKPKRIYWDLHESHETEEINKLCVVKKIIEAFKVHHNIGDRIPVNLRATWVFLCTSLNYYVKDIERHIKDMLLESNSEENTKRSAMLAISLHRQQFLTELCKNGMSLKAMLSSPGFMSRLYSKASWREYADIKEGRGLQKSHIESNLKRHIELNIGSIDDGVPLEEPELLFITSVLESKLEVSILYWSHVRHPLAAALIAYGIFKAMRNSRSNDQKILKENMVTYRKLAIEATFKGFFSSKTRLFELLAAGIPEWGHLSCIDIALATGNKKFLSKTPTIELRNHIWSKETLSNDALNAGPVSTCIHITPIRIWWFSFISYIILLGLYSFMLLTSLETATFNVLEWFLWFLFLVVVFLKVAILRKRQNMGLSKDNFHVLKSTSLAFFFLAWIFRIAAYCRIDVPELMQFSRVFYSASFILWSLGLLKYCYYFEYLGPIVAMILEMFSTLVKFLVVILICMVAYSVASESVLYPNAEINVKLPFFVLRKSFWSIFGQFFLEEIESIDRSCTNDPAIYIYHPETRCPSVEGRYWVPMILGAFVLVVNILLINLLIAKFNSIIISIEIRALKIWHYQNFQIAMESREIQQFLFHKNPPNNPPTQSREGNFEKEVIRHLTQEINDGRFFERLENYKKSKAKDLPGVFIKLKEIIDSQVMHGNLLTKYKTDVNKVQGTIKKVDLLQQTRHEQSLQENRNHFDQLDQMYHNIQECFNLKIPEVKEEMKKLNAESNAILNQMYHNIQEIFDGKISEVKEEMKKLNAESNTIPYQMYRKIQEIFDGKISEVKEEMKKLNAESNKILIESYEKSQEYYNRKILEVKGDIKLITESNTILVKMYKNSQYNFDRKISEIQEEMKKLNTEHNTFLEIQDKIKELVTESKRFLDIQGEIKELITESKEFLDKVHNYRLDYYDDKISKVEKNVRILKPQIKRNIYDTYIDIKRCFNEKVLEIQKEMKSLNQESKKNIVDKVTKLEETVQQQTLRLKRYISKLGK